MLREKADSKQSTLRLPDKEVSDRAAVFEILSSIYLNAPDASIRY